MKVVRDLAITLVCILIGYCCVYELGIKQARLETAREEAKKAKYETYITEQEWQINEKKLQIESVRLDINKIRLNAFLKAYSNGRYFVEIEEIQ